MSETNEKTPWPHYHQCSDPRCADPETLFSATCGERVPSGRASLTGNVTLTRRCARPLGPNGCPEHPTAAAPSTGYERVIREAFVADAPTAVQPEPLGPDSFRGSDYPPACSGTGWCTKCGKDHGYPEAPEQPVVSWKPLYDAIANADTQVILFAQEYERTVAALREQLAAKERECAELCATVDSLRKDRLWLTTKRRELTEEFRAEHKRADAAEKECEFLRGATLLNRGLCESAQARAVEAEGRIAEAVRYLQPMRLDTHASHENKDCWLCFGRELLTILTAPTQTAATKPPVHHYLSTACQHFKHEACRKACKFCQAKCWCVCHKPDATTTTGRPICADAVCDCDAKATTEREGADRWRWECGSGGLRSASSFDSAEAARRHHDNTPPHTVVCMPFIEAMNTPTPQPATSQGGRFGWNCNSNSARGFNSEEEALRHHLSVRHTSTIPCYVTVTETAKEAR